MSESRERYVLLYDGFCRFCIASRDLLKRWDRQDRIEPRSFRDPGVLDEFPSISWSQALKSIHVVSPDGSVHGEEEAVRVLLRFAPWYLRWVALTFYVPGVPAIARRIYRWFSVNRFRLGGVQVCEGDACAVHLGHKPKTQLEIDPVEEAPKAP